MSQLLYMTNGRSVFYCKSGVLVVFNVRRDKRKNVIERLKKIPLLAGF